MSTEVLMNLLNELGENQNAKLCREFHRFWLRD